MLQIQIIRRFEFSKISESEIWIVKVEFRSGSQIRFRIRSKLISADWVYIKFIILYTYLICEWKVKYKYFSYYYLYIFVITILSLRVYSEHLYL